jgi:hypothetical protein
MGGVIAQSPETGSMRGQNYSFGHIPSIEQSKIDVFITVVRIFLQFSMVFLRNGKLCTASIV